MSIPFIDLKAQYNRLRDPIGQRMQTVLEHGQFVSGPEVAEFENALTQFVGCKHAISVASGTDALLISLMALDIGPGDEVITPAFSFVAAAEMILFLGARPVLVDIDPVSYNVKAEHIKNAISDKTKAIIPISLYGQTPDMDEINAVAGSIPVIEDAAQSMGASYKNKLSGQLSKIACTSFFPTKPLGCFGDGGAIFTDDDKLAEICQQIRIHGQSGHYLHSRIGFTGRMDTLQCAILLAKMPVFADDMQKRFAIGQRYNESLKGLKAIQIPEVGANRTHVFAQYTLSHPQRDQVMEKLKQIGVPTTVHYPKAVHQQPAYIDQCRLASDLVQSNKAANEVFSLPMYVDMPESIQNKVIEKVKSVISEF